MRQEAIYLALAPGRMVSELDEVLQLPQRKLVISQSEIFLDKMASNTVFVLMVEESRGSAGGRAAGSGSRRIDRVYGFSCRNGACTKIFETMDESRIGLFEIPYSAVAMDIRLSDGKTYVVQGLVDPALISSYLDAVSNLK